ncbi:proline racemase family protein [Streptomyces sp. NPDC001100]
MRRVPDRPWRRAVRSAVGSRFVCAVVAETTADDGTAAVVPSVTGMAYRCGSSRFTVDPGDPLASGFVLR